MTKPPNRDNLMLQWKKDFIFIEDRHFKSLIKQSVSLKMPVGSKKFVFLGVVGIVMSSGFFVKDNKTAEDNVKNRKRIIANTCSDLKNEIELAKRITGDSKKLHKALKKAEESNQKNQRNIP